MTVKDYQIIQDIRESTDIDDFDKSAWAVCYVLGLKPEQVDSQPRKFARRMVKTERRINKATIPMRFARAVNTDAERITFGQFVEVIEWLKFGDIEQMHMIYATLLNTGNHQHDAQRALKMNVRLVLPYVLEFITSFDNLLSRFKNLFEPPKQEDGGKPEPPHPFMQMYGWQYQAKVLAEYMGGNYTVNDAFNMNIIEALNTLALLKSKSDYDAR